MSQQKGPGMAGPFSSRLIFGLQAELIDEANTGDKELVVAAGRRREHVAADRSTGVRHADDAVAESEVVALAVHADPQPFELDGEVIGPGVLDTGAEHPPNVVAAGTAEERAIADRGPNHGRRRTDVERCRKLTAVRYAEEGVVVIAIIGEGETTGGVDEHAIEAVANPEACGRKPITAADTAAALIEQGDVRPRHRNPDDTGAGRQERCDRSMVEEVAAEEAGVLAVIIAAQPLDVSLDTDNEARARRELIVEADLGATDEAVPVAAALSTLEQRAGGQRERSNPRSARSRINGNDTAAEAADAGLVVAVVPAVAGVHANIEAGPGEDRDGREVRGGSGAAREVRGHRPSGEAQKGYRGEKKLLHGGDPYVLIVVGTK